jgi:glycosyltransferase involved in cell wall biosynthesis
VGLHESPQNGSPRERGAVPPEITIVIPTRNRKAFLEQAVHDALRQQDVSLEIVVVDDGSTIDGVLDGIDDLAQSIRVIRHATRRGVAAARNTGIHSARGEWVAFFDDDDRWSPTKLRTQLDTAAKLDATWVYSGALTIDARDRVLLLSPALDPANVVRCLPEYNAIPGGGSNVIARTDLVRAIGGFDERLALIADWDMWIRLVDNAWPAACDDLLVAYRLHPQNMHVSAIDTIDSELSHIVRKYSGAPPGQRVTPDIGLVLGYQGDAHRRHGRRSAAARLFLRRWQVTHDVRDLRRALLALLGERLAERLRRSRPRTKLARPSWLDDRTQLQAVTTNAEVRARSWRESAADLPRM